ncbi:unnamed protein product [Chrysoparadoxa australica]
METYFGTPNGQRVLVIGCGNSTLPADLYHFGFTYVTAIDSCALVVAQMQAKYQDLEGLEYVVMDACCMEGLPNEGYDCIFDKGCIDSLFCTINSWADVLKANQGCCRLLRGDGVFLSLSHGHPHTRLQYYRDESLQWVANAVPLHETEDLFIYAMSKLTGEQLTQARRERAEELTRQLPTGLSATGTHSACKDPRVQWRPGNEIIELAPPVQLNAADAKRRRRSGHPDSDSDNNYEDGESHEGRAHAEHYTQPLSKTDKVDLDPDVLLQAISKTTP